MAASAHERKAPTPTVIPIDLAPRFVEAALVLLMLAAAFALG